MIAKEMNLDPWQKQVLKHKGNLVLCTGRQIGKSYILSRKCAEYMLANPKHQVIVVSLTEDQAQLIIVMILTFLELENKKFIAKGKNKPTKGSITLTNKAKIISRPVGQYGSSIRGYTADVLVVDEASRMPEMMWEAVRPTLMTTAGKLWMASTPHGKQGYFYEAFLNKHKRFKVWHVSSVDAIQKRPISPSWTETQRTEAIKFIEEERIDMTELSFGQELEGKFLDDLQRMFSDDQINKCCILKRQTPSPKYENYMGCDLARMGRDASTFEILHISETSKITRQIENIVTWKTPTTQTEQRIIQLTNMFNIRKVGIDCGSGSLGTSIYDHLLQHPTTKRKVIPMNNRKMALDREGKETQRIFKEDMYENLLSMMEHDELLLLNDENIITSLRSVQQEIVHEKGRQSRTRVFSNPHSESHIAEGLTRAAWLAKKEKSKRFFIDYI